MGVIAQNHIIKKINFNLELDNGTALTEVRESVLQKAKTDMTSRMLALFDNLSVSNEVIRIENLAIDLGDVQVDDLASRFITELENSIIIKASNINLNKQKVQGAQKDSLSALAQLSESPNSNDSSKSQKVLRDEKDDFTVNVNDRLLDGFIDYLKTGTIAWWNNSNSKTSLLSFFDSDVLNGNAVNRKTNLNRLAAVLKFDENTRLRFIVLISAAQFDTWLALTRKHTSQFIKYETISFNKLVAHILQLNKNTQEKTEKLIQLENQLGLNKKTKNEPQLFKRFYNAFKRVNPVQYSQFKNENIERYFSGELDNDNRAQNYFQQKGIQNRVDFLANFMQMALTHTQVKLDQYHPVELILKFCKSQNWILTDSNLNKLESSIKTFLSKSKFENNGKENSKVEKSRAQGLQDKPEDSSVINSLNPNLQSEFQRTNSKTELSKEVDPANNNEEINTARQGRFENQIDNGLDNNKNFNPKLGHPNSDQNQEIRAEVNNEIKEESKIDLDSKKEAYQANKTNQELSKDKNKAEQEANKGFKGSSKLSKKKTDSLSEEVGGQLINNNTEKTNTSNLSDRQSNNSDSQAKDKASQGRSPNNSTTSNNVDAERIDRPANLESGKDSMSKLSNSKTSNLDNREETLQNAADAELLKSIFGKKGDEEELMESIALNYAGIVLLWPMIKPVFEDRGYLTDKAEFKNQATQFQALNLLNYIVSGSEELDEIEMTLNKVLCNIPIVTPVYLDTKLTKEDKEEVQALYAHVIATWKVLKNTSTDGLRASFIKRTGGLSENSEQWILKVEQHGIDALIDKIPWGFRMIKLPWMSKFLIVEW